MAGIDDEIITRYAKEQLEKPEIRQQLTQQVLTSKLYDTIEKTVALDKKTVSLDDFKKKASIDTTLCRELHSDRGLFISVRYFQYLTGMSARCFRGLERSFMAIAST